MGIPHKFGKAYLLMAQGKVEHVEGNHWRVGSVSEPGATHEVHFQGSGGSCDCKGFKYRHTCSHIEAVRLVWQQEHMEYAAPLPGEME